MAVDDEIVIRKVRRYNYPVVNKIFVLNTPRYFECSQLENLSVFLEKNNQDYYVIYLGEEIIGSGGYIISYTKIAFISWIMIHPQYQNQGFGSLILKDIIKLIGKARKVKTVEVLTTQHAHRFFVKKGFVLEDIRDNFWAEDLNLYRLRMKLKKKFKKFVRYEKKLPKPGLIKTVPRN